MNSVDTQTSQSSWTNKHKLGKFFIFALFGPGLPMILALFTVPFLILKLGVERYGLLNLAWVILGYFTLFDLGLGRAAVRMYADLNTQGKKNNLRPLYLTTFLSTFCIGSILGICFGLSTDYSVTHFFNIKPELQSEARWVMLCLSFAMPFIALSSILKSFLEAEAKFFLSNALQAFLGVLTYLGPATVLFFQDSLVLVVLTILISRGFVFLIYWKLSWNLLPPKHDNKKFFNFEIFKELLEMGKWVTLSNIIGPIMTYADRFIIGSVLSLAAVGYYSTPYDLITRAWILTGALNSVLFPALSSLAHTNKEKSDELFIFGLETLVTMCFPILLVLSIFAPEILKIWLGAEFANQAFLSLQIFCVGMFFNILAQVVFVYLQSLKRADLPAKIHLFEVIFYLTLVYWAAKQNLHLVAVAWSIRMFVDFLLMCLALIKISPSVRAQSVLYLKKISIYPIILFLIPSIFNGREDLNWIRYLVFFAIASFYLFYTLKSYILKHEWQKLLSLKSIKA